MVAAGLFAAAVLMELDNRVGFEALQDWPRLFGAGSDGSRSMLSALATSMITVAGVTFSITMVALAQTSAMYSPRLLRTFMGDRSTQLVLGMFVGIFAYCLVVLRSIASSEAEVEFIPRISVFAGVVLGLISIGFLVYFIHHIASTLQPSNILSNVSHETIASVDHLFPEPLGEEADPQKSPEIQARVENTAWTPVASETTGYLQGVSPSDLLAFAEEKDVTIRMEVPVGGFVVEGDPLVSVAVSNGAQVEGELREMLPVGMYRTIEQDASYGIEQLADVAAKALSPSVNDARTAITCIHYLTAVLCRLGARRIETPYRCGRDRQLRVVAIGPSFEVLVDRAFDPILRNAGDRRDVFEAVVCAIDAISRRTTSKGRLNVLATLLQRVRGGVQQTIQYRGNQEALLYEISTVAQHLRNA
jgi:uncharacterized membrane protein